MSPSVRYALRSLSRTPGFTFTIVLTLAFGIGANSTVFSVLDAVLFEPLPFPNAERLVYVRQTVAGVATDSVGPLRLENWNARSDTFDALTGYSTEDVADTSGDFAERRRLARVAPRFFDVWGINPVLGRGFADSDHETGAAPIVVISARYWEHRFSSDPGVLDSVVRIGEESFQLVGVMGDGFAFPDPSVDYWAPMIYEPDFNRGSAWYAGYGRIKEGVTTDQAQADLVRIQSQLAQEYPDTDRTIGVVIEPLKDATVGEIRGSLWLLYGTVTVLLLIACANIAALLLARESERRRDSIVRRVLGASRASLAMRSLTETLVLTVCGSIGGLLIAAGATAALRRFLVGLPRLDQISVDSGVVAYTSAAVLIVTLFCGLLPALRYTDDTVESSVVSGSSRWQVSSQHSAQWLLVGAQVSLSVVLLTGAGLLARSLYELATVDPGFDASNVLTFRISGNFGERTPIAQTVEGVLTEIAAMPQVSGAAVSSPVPGVFNDRSGFDFSIGTYRRFDAAADSEGGMPADTRIVSSTYFDVMRIPRLEGESCASAGGEEFQDIAVNQRFATQYFDGRSPLGQPLLSPRGDALRIVAIYADAREFGPDRSPVPVVYDCRTAVAYPPLAFVVRTNGDPESVISSLRQTLKRVEPGRALYDVSALDRRMGAEFESEILRTTLVGLFAAGALTLACLGLYGTLAYVVNLRRREIGLRIAMGAQRSYIVRNFIGEAMRVVVVAAMLGLAGSVVASRLLSSMLFEISANDPLTVSATVAIVLLVAVWAALVPSLKASRVDPMVALRQD